MDFPPNKCDFWKAFGNCNPIQKLQRLYYISVTKIYKLNYIEINLIIYSCVHIVLKKTQVYKRTIKL